MRIWPKRGDAVFVDLLLYLSFPGLLVVLLAVFIGSIWVVRLLLKRRWKPAILMTLTSVVAMSGLLWLATTSRERELARYLVGLFATQVELPPPLFDHDPARTWLGDGFSLSVHELPAAIRERFQAADQRLLTAHPQLPGVRRGWTVQTWTTGPLDARTRAVLDFTFSGSYLDKDPDLARHCASAQERIIAPQTYYAYFLEQHDSHITNVDLFIVDLVASRLYFINLNT
jgi:hypothetical protein